MKTFTIILLALMGMTLGLVGCDDDNDRIIVQEPDIIPEPPQGVFSITGDSEVFIYWNGPYIADIAEYVVYRSLDPVDNYAPIATITAQDNPNLDLIVYEYIDATAANGTTYYYAVTSVDDAGQESVLSAENVFDTPRPEGIATVSDSVQNLSTSGIDLSASGAVIPGNSVNADVVFDIFDGVWYINVADVDTDIQDLGFTADDFTTIGWAPQDGWSLLGFSEMIVGHTYVIWTRDDHFAKIRVESLGASTAQIRWAYQTDQGNPELAPYVPERPDPNSKITNKQSLRDQVQAR